MRSNILCEVMFLVAMVAVKGETPCESPTVPSDACSCTVDDNTGEQSISCRYRNLTAIPEFRDTGIVYKKLDFGQTEEAGSCKRNCNNITRVESDAFKNISVKEINLQNIQISYFDDYAFDNQKGKILNILHLEGDNNSEPPYTAIELLDNLTELSLRHYRQTTMNVALKTPQLKILTLESFEDLSGIEPVVFVNCKTTLEQLTLNRLSLQEIPVLTLQQLISLKHLDIIATSISAVRGDSFQDLGNLTELKITQSFQLSTIQDNAFNGIKDTVTHLTVSNNDNLNSNLGFLGGTWNVLNHLDLSFNPHLGNLPPNAFSTLNTLEYLQLQEIGMMEIADQTFSGLVNLHTLDISYNKLTQLNKGALTGLPNVVELKMNYQLHANPITLQSNLYEDIEGVQLLQMQNNIYNPTELWSLISKLPNITELDLQETNLQEIPDKVFAYNTKLQTLKLSFNNISTIRQATFFGPKMTLRDVELRNNTITILDSCVLSDFPTKPTLYLSENLLHCDCEITWLHDLVHNDRDAALHVGPCYSPPALAGQLFTDFTSNDLCPAGPTIRTCPDLYATTTTTTSTTTTTTTTTPPPPTPVFSLVLVQTGVDWAKLSWSIDDRTYLTDMKLGIVSPEKTVSLGKDSTDHTFYTLEAQKSYTFCLTLRINDQWRDADFKCVQGSTKSPATTTTEATTEAPESNIGIIAGATAGGIVFVVLVIVILVVLMKANTAQKKPPPIHTVSYQPGGTLPHAGGTTKRFAKKPHKEGATPDDIDVKIISNGDMTNKGRISAGSYQFLNDKGVDNRPMPSTSKDGYVNATLTAGHYTNAVEDRPLPKAPKGANGHGYVNDGFRNRPETSINEYSDISEGKPSDISEGKWI